MQIKVDTDTGTFDVTRDGTTQSFGLHSKEAFDESDETPDCSHHPVGWLQRKG